MSKRTLSVAPPAALAADYPRSAISETVSGKFGLAELAKVFTLPWSAYALLISVKDARGSVAGIPSSRLRLSCRRHDNRAGHPFYLGVASRTIIWPLVKQIRPLQVPLLHGLHRRLAAQC